MKKKTDEEIINAVKNCQTMSEAARSIDMPFMSFRYRAQKLNVYEPNQSRKGMTRPASEYSRIAIPLDEILEGLHPHYMTGHLKRRLLKVGIKKEICEGNGCMIKNEWLGLKLVLHLDHIDGNSKNHKLENLRLLCPNCHSQTSTYTGKNVR